MDESSIPGSQPVRTVAATGNAAARAFTVVALALLPLMVALSGDFGVTWDEKIRQKNGEVVWDYWAGRLPRSHFEQEGQGYSLYGGLFDVVCVGVQHLLPAVDRYVVRHAVGASLGWLTICLAGLIARHLFGSATGLLAMILLALSPRFVAHSMNNPKDIPFAACSTLALYFIVTIPSRYPFLTPGRAARLAAAVALGVNVRAGALVSLFYAGVAVAFRMLAAREFAARRVAATAVSLAAVTVAALLLGTVTWPWALSRPIVGPIRALTELSEFDWGGAVLFKGTSVVARALPADYVPTWFAITTPFVVLTGAALSLAWLRPAPRGRWAAAAGLWGVVLFPVVMVIARGSTLYDEIRHLLFVYPPLVVLAAAGWRALAVSPSRLVARVALAALVAGCLEPAVFMVRNHPNQVVYFNALAGGPAGAFGRYEMDYWGNCVFQAVEWSAELAARSRYPLIVSGYPDHIVQFDTFRFSSLGFSLPRRARHHLEVRLLRGPARAVIAEAARPDILHRVETADGATLCVVVPGPRFREIHSRLVWVPAR
jgi:hypothetical protein